MGARTFWAELTTGWGVTWRKWSVRITAVEAVVMGFLGACAMVLPWWALAGAYAVFLLARMGAANLPQANIASYDPRYFRLVPIEETADAASTSP